MSWGGRFGLVGMELALEFVGRDLALPQGCLPLFGQCFLSLLKTDGDGSVLVLPLSPHCSLSWCKDPPLCKVPSVETSAPARDPGICWQKQSPAWPAPPSHSHRLPPPWPGQVWLQLCHSVLPPAPSRVLVGFLELYMGLLLSLYILFWALAWGHLFSVSMWRVSCSPVLL